MAFPGSPIPPPQNLLTPPDSPRKRRQVLRESEESQGDMTLEQYLLSSDPYRTTSLPVPWPHPFPLNYEPQLQLQVASLNDEIRKTLTDYGFSESVSFVAFEARKPLYPGEDDSVNLLFVFFDAQDTVPRRLGPAKDALLQLLHDNRITDMHVEIANRDLVFMPSLFPLGPEHPAVRGYEQAKGRLVRILDGRLDTQWRVLCVFNVGRNERKATPSIVVLVDPLSFADWNDLASEIHSEISKYMPDNCPNIEFLPGNLSTLQQEGVSYLDRLGPAGIPEMGFSVGIRGDHNAGTMGGFVTLTQNGKLYRGILTNYHVVRPSDPQSGRDSFVENLDRRGLSPAEALDRNIQIESLAQMDRDATITEVDRMLQGVRDIVEEYSSKIEERALVGARAIPNLQVMLESNQAALPDLEQKRALLRSMPHLMGQVLCCSGKAILGRRIADWAFVALSQEATEKYFQPNKMFAIPDGQKPHWYNPRFGMALPEGSPLTELGRLVKGNYYVKVGRSTGVTAGICHGALACANWNGKNGERYDHNGRKVDISQGITEEYVIMSKTLNQSEYKQSSYADTGDSGSFVVDIEGKICGLLYGGISGLSGPPGKDHYYVNAGLVMDMPDLMSSIKLRTLCRDASGAPIGLPAELGLPGP